MEQTLHTNPSHFESMKVPQVPHYENPVPVAVALIPVQAVDPQDGILKIGLLVGRRGIEPKLGEFALPGGYIEYEDWRDAVLREVSEEIGIDLGSSEQVKLVGVESVDQMRRLIVFGETEVISAKALDGVMPTSECTEIRVIFAPQSLAFESHTKMVREYFARTAQRAS